MTLRWPRVISVAASELELGVPERKEPEDGEDIHPWCTPPGGPAWEAARGITYCSDNWIL